MKTLALGTRGSKLALTQSQLVADALTKATGHEVELVTITTSGDKSTAPLSSIGGTGVFVSALRDAVLAGDVDFAVHSLKDLPTAPADGLVVAATPRRADARDALCARDGLALAELPSGAKIGTGSPRRAAQLRSLGLGFDVVPIRGNVDTRLAKVTNGELDAVVLAWAGLDRLGRLDAVTEALDPMQVLPAPGQGALAVECRVDDDELTATLANLDDVATRAAVTAERKLLAVLEAGCTAPVGAYAEVSEVEPNGGSAHGGSAGDEAPWCELYLRAVVSSEDGTEHIRKSATGSVERAADLGRNVAEEMLADGAGAIVGAQRGTPKEERVP